MSIESQKGDKIAAGSAENDYPIYNYYLAEIICTRNKIQRSFFIYLFIFFVRDARATLYLPFTIS